MAFGAKIKACLFLTVSWLTFNINVLAQETFPLYFLSDVPQATFENPAIQNNTGKLVIGIPVLSGVYGNWDASVPLNSLFSKGFSYSFHRFYDTLDEQGQAQTSAGITMFFASLNHNEFSFSLSVSERGFSTGEFDREIVKFIRDGNMSFYGVDENLGDASFFLTHFREMTAGISKQIGNNLAIGIRPKLLFGKFNFKTQNLNFSVETDFDKKKLFFEHKGSFELTGPFTHMRDTVLDFSNFAANISPGDYFFQPRNMGFAFDLGAVFRPTKHSEWSFSIVDAGFIGFRHNSYNVEFIRPISYSEYSIYQSHTPDVNYYIEPREALKAFGDSVSYVIEVAGSDKRIVSGLPLKINLAGKYKIAKNTNVGIRNQLTMYKNQPQNRFTPFITTSFHPKSELYGSLTLLNANSILAGLGASYTNEWLQIFLATNNISGIIQPPSSKHLNLCFGINFLFDTQ